MAEGRSCVFSAGGLVVECGVSGLQEVCAYQCQSWSRAARTILQRSTAATEVFCWLLNLMCYQA